VQLCGRIGRCRLEVLGLPEQLDGIYSDQQKPDPGTLVRIAADARVLPEAVLYVGDNLWKDVAMAQRAGVHVAWARYGMHRTIEAEDLLKQLCHGSPQDTVSENVSASTIQPPLMLDRGLSELLDHFTFVPHG
jgi:phosphoglycolate phosphatase